MAKRTLHPALRANADRLKRGEPLHDGKKKGSATAQKPKIKSKQKKG
jgi:hypothetical protein